MLGLQNEREWAIFCKIALQKPELAIDERFNTTAKRTGNREALQQIIVDCFAPMTAEQVLARLDEAGIANAHVNDMAAVWEHPQLKARGRWTEVDTTPAIWRGT